MALTKAHIARIRSLQDKRTRDQLGLFVVEGAKVVRELLSAGYVFQELYCTPAAEPLPDVSPAPVIVSPAEMQRLSHYPTPSDWLAIGTIPRTELAPEELDRGHTLALDGIQDPGNVGTLVRIADWFGLDRVVLSPDSADAFGQKAINASMGSFARVRVIRTAIAPVLRTCRATIVGCDLSGTSVYTWQPPDAAVVVIGSEGRGLSSEVDALLRERVTIPRAGQAESLNAAVAAGIVCAQLRRPRLS